MEIPRINMAEVFVDGRCVGLLSDIKLSRSDAGEFDVEGEWSGYSDIFSGEKMFTISIPRYEFRFLADKVDAVKVRNSGRISFKGASFLPDSPGTWFNELLEPPDDFEIK